MTFTLHCTCSRTPPPTASFTPRDDQCDELTMNDPTPFSPQDFHDYYPHPHENHGSSPRKTKPFSSPLTKKIRIATTTDWTSADGQDPYATAPLSPPRQTSPSPTRHNSRSAAAPRQQTTKQAVLPPTPTTTTTANVLAPCHICHRKPTKKTELDSYADCEGCGERTCYVCIRACLGGWKSPTTTTHRETHQQDFMRDENHDHWQCQDQSFTMEDAPATDDGSHSPKHTKREETWGKGGGTGHRGRICSQCCVEEGPEGEVICLGCLGT